MTERADVAQDVVSLTLAPADEVVDLPGWEAGAHVELVLGEGLVRQYSLCGPLSDRSAYRIAVLRSRGGRGGSQAVHRLEVGDEVCVREPRNHFRLEPAEEYLFIAGGIGVTPMLPMTQAADAAGIPWRLVYGGRTTRSMAFLDELRLRQGQVQVVPEDRHGQLDLRAIVGDAPGASVYACGPEPMLAALEEACAGLGRPRPHVERFAAAVVERLAERSFTVQIASSGRMVEVPAHSSVLEALESAGLSPAFSCREGTCGTCEIGVLGGEVDHRDVLLTDDERAANDTMMICVSRSAGGDLVLDL